MKKKIAPPKKAAPLKFRVSVGAIKTLAEGGANVVFTFSNDQVGAIMELINIRLQPNMYLDIVANRVIVLPKVDHAKEKERAEKAKKKNISRRKQTYPYKKAIAKEAGK